MNENNKPIVLKPMLAIEFEKIKLDESIPYFASPKIDGIRFLIVDGVCYSRSLKPVRNVCIQKFVNDNIEFLEGFDGEITVESYKSDSCFRDTTSVVMSTDGGENFIFHVFDNIKLFGMPYSKRYEYIKSSIHKFNCKKVKLVEHIPIVSIEHLMKLEEEYLSLGYEGIMLNNPTSTYKNGRSGKVSPELIKKKLFTDREFLIIGYDQLYVNNNEQKENSLGYMERSCKGGGLVACEKLGSIRLITPEGNEFNCGSGFDDDMRYSMWQNREALIGKFAKIKYFDKGDYIVPRFPIFLGIRDDEDLDNE